MSWRVAKSLEILLGQINAISPRRDKSSDGGIGNAEHASRSSDHNPWVMDGNMGIVTARDFTNDPAHGIVSEQLAEALRGSRDSRIKYIISNRKICSGSAQANPAWEWRPYHGANPHDHHFHISVKSDKAHYDDESLWSFDTPKVTPEAHIAPEVATKPLLVRGAKDASLDGAVHDLQAALNKKGASIAIDGSFGPATEVAVRQFQHDAGLVVDGEVGAYTWRALA